MEENKINKRIVFSIVSIILLLIVVSGATYAFFSAGGSTALQTVTTANMDLAFDDNTEMINAANIEPITTDQVLTKAAKKSFTIKKSTTNSQDMYVKISLTDITVTNPLAVYDFKWALYQGQNKIATGDFGGKTNGSIVLATNQFINSTTGLTYDLYIWINETGLNQNSMQGQTFGGRITVDGSVTKLNTLASVILGENNSNVSPTAPGGFNGETLELWTTDRGLYVQENDVTKSEMGFPTYYFRGSATNTTLNSSYVMNNYVKFGKYQTSDGGNTIGDDIVWRVVRINEDGSIKLINQNGLDGTKYNLNYDDGGQYVFGDGSDSNIKSYVETWYSNNIGNTSTLDSKVVKSTFCETKTFICPADKTKFYEKIGLLTYGEVYNAGGNEGPISGNMTYLHNGNEFYFLSDTNGDSSLTYWQQPGLLWNGASDYDLPARVVINLSPDVEVSSGDGLSADTAYVIK